MALDPRELIRRSGLGSESASAVAIAELQRPDAGLQRGGIFVPDVVAVGGVNQAAVLDAAMLAAQNAPSVKIHVPEPGGFIQFYGEVQGRITALNAALPGGNVTWVEMQIVDDLYLAGDVENGIYAARGSNQQLNSNVRLGMPTGWKTVRQPGTPGPTSSNGAAGYAGMGVLGTQWSPAGDRTLRIGCIFDGQGMAAGDGSVAEYRNRRLMARIVV